jgi:hypothetical protein
MGESSPCDASAFNSLADTRGVGVRNIEVEDVLGARAPLTDAEQVKVDNESRAWFAQQTAGMPADQIAELANALGMDGIV